MKTWMFLLLLHLGICTAPTPTTSRQYHFISSPKSWTEAQSYCRATYTDLATVDNIEDLNQLLMSGSDPFGWIGLYEDINSWRWSLADSQYYGEASSATKPEKQQHSAHSEDGRLFYDGEWYGRGQNICIDKKDKYPTRAVITTVNHEEVWFKRLDGSKSKLYISQLQKGKYTIKHS